MTLPPEPRPTPVTPRRPIDPASAAVRVAAATADAKRRLPFRNALEAGFPEPLLRAIGDMLEAHGSDPKLRFITFARAPEAPLRASEARLSHATVREARDHAARLGVWSVYIPRPLRGSRPVIDHAGIHWLHGAGFASRTIMDLYGLSATRLFALLRGQPRPTHRVRQIRDASGHAEAHAVGLGWFERHGRTSPPDASATERARVARCGHALMRFREHFGREPRRGGLAPSEDAPGTPRA
jgi:hypothetical protein